jgi:molybdate transport system permease protein
LSSSALTALWISLKVSLVATLVVLPPGIALGLLFARRRFPGKSVLETLTYLPLVLPPTAVGYLLLSLLARRGPLGANSLGFDLDFLFTWKGAVLASSVMALPLVVRTARIAFEGVSPRLESMGRTLGMSPLRVLWEITLPLARRGLLASGVLGFSRALGEFGATVIVAGNIPGKTQTLALAIFNDIQIGRDDEARRLVGLTAVLAFFAIWISERLQSRRRKRAR